MESKQFDQAADGRLRFVFEDAVVSFDLEPGATLADIARKWGRLSRGRHGHPVGVVVTLPVMPDARY